MVIEERDLVFPTDTPRAQRDIYRKFYSVARLRRLSEKRYLDDMRRHDLWLALQACFRLFEADGPGAKLGIAPLAGDLFSAEAVSSLANCTLSNDVLLGSLRSLGLYRHPDSGQLIRVNYAALNVEEFGSVYEGLLEYEPEFAGEGHELWFGFRRGGERAATGSHYTPDDLVQPLIRHSLDHLIAERLKADDPEAALLELRVADIACGSGHILLAAARRIGTELAVVRTGEEQPSPPAYRAALRDAIRHCIYGVDLNPLAVELCKVALWVEAHIPGQPLNFLDHHIKCGNAIVGFARHKELCQGVPTEAFKTLPGDDKEIASAYRKKNKEDLRHQKQASLDFTPELRGRLNAVLEDWQLLSALPEQTPAQIDAKKERFTAFSQGEHAGILRAIADIPVAQFYIPKVPGNEAKLVTDGGFRSYWRGQLAPQGPGADAARSLGEQRRFFHWFLEFPEIMDRGGFNCILGNPPYLGGQALSGTYGYAFCECMKWRFARTGLSELVVYFLRRIHGLLRDGGFTAIITTNSIVDGDVRKDGLEQVLAAGAQINMAVRGMRWPGTANLVVSLLAMHKGEWNGLRLLDNQPATIINAFFEESDELGEPLECPECDEAMFMGTIYLGDGFVLDENQSAELYARGVSNGAIRSLLNGKEVNSSPRQMPERKIIFLERYETLHEAESHEPVAVDHLRTHVLPDRLAQKNERAKARWWRYYRFNEVCYQNLRSLETCFVAARTTKHLSFSALPTDYVYSDALYVFTTGRWDLFTVVQSTLHEVWARKYSGSLKQDLRYSPSKCFNTFAFPAGLWQTTDPGLAKLGERYHAHRKALMHSLWLGLTKIYNLFHARDLSAETVAQVSKKDADTAATGFEALLELRQLHVELDNAVRDTYGWQDLDLEHGFHEVETLPENDRVRYTVSHAARREVLKRLLAENHARAKFEAKIPAPRPTRGGRKRMAAAGPDLFGVES